jgi:hypothetical protein
MGILEKGLPLKKRKLFEFLTEEGAYILERRLIREFGRSPSGLLVNLTDGGEGFNPRECIYG